MGTKAFLRGVFCFIFVALTLIVCKKDSSTPTTPTIPTTPAKNPPVINSFSASPNSINYGESAILSWSITGASSASIDQGIGGIANSGTYQIKPTSNTAYTLTASNNDGTVTKACNIEVKSVALMVFDGDPIKSMTSYDRPVFKGYVKNIGNITGYNCGIDFRAYSDVNRTTIIDTASGFPGNLGDIDPGQRAYYEAVFFDLRSWDQIKSWDYKITWLNKRLPPEQQLDFIEGWGR